MQPLKCFRYSPCAVAFLAVSATAGAAQHCVILQYHHVSVDTPSITSVTPGQFQQHLDYLHKHSFHVLPLSEVVSKLATREELPDNCVSLTIDDAFNSAYTEAWPRARRYGYPLTVFVSTESIDRHAGSHMSWDTMREMAADGVEFQNHSHSHDHLVRLHDGESEDDWEQRVAAELVLAQNRIQQELGSTPTLFAYPYGEYNTPLKRLAGSMGLTGFGQQSGPAWSDGDFAALPRFPMNTLYASMRTFPTKVRTLPMPLVSAEPQEPLVENDVWQPTLSLTFRPETRHLKRLTCFVNGSPDVEYRWASDRPAVDVTPKGVLQVGRNRYNCTMPGPEGRYHWYSHNWLRRNSDGSWYRETAITRH